MSSVGVSWIERNGEKRRKRKQKVEPIAPTRIDGHNVEAVFHDRTV